LESYFSKIYCLRLPAANNAELTLDNGTKLKGSVLIKDQFNILNRLLDKIHRKQVTQRITYPQWLYLIKEILPLVISEKSLSMYQYLLHITDDRIGSVSNIDIIFLLLFTKIEIQSPEWFQYCRKFAMRILARLIAVKFHLRVRELTSIDLIKDKCEKNLRKLFSDLDNFKPCEALYTGRGNTATGHSIYCYQKKGAHHKSHRSFELVYNLSWLKKFFVFSSHAVWPGYFESTVSDKYTQEELKSVIDMTQKHIQKFQTATICSSFVELLNRYNLLQFVKEKEGCSASGTNLKQKLKNRKSQKQKHIHCNCCFQNVIHVERFLSPIIAVCRDCFKDVVTTETNNLVHHLSTSNDNAECIICMDNERTHLFEPCSHLKCCSGCAQRIIADKQCCPVCRHNITGIKRAYL